MYYNFQCGKGDCVAPQMDGVDKTELSDVLLWLWQRLPLSNPLVRKHTKQWIIDTPKIDAG